MILTSFWPVLAWSQAGVTDPPNFPDYASQSPTSQSNSPPPAPLPDSPAARPKRKQVPEDKKDDAEAQQSKRMFYVIPNFAAVNAHTELPPLSTREKFVLAAHDSLIDYSSFVWTGILAGQAIEIGKSSRMTAHTNEPTN